MATDKAAEVHLVGLVAGVFRHVAAEVHLVGLVAGVFRHVAAEVHLPSLRRRLGRPVGD